MFITRNKIIEKLCYYEQQADKEYFVELDRIDDMPLEAETKMELKQQAFWETQGKLQMLEKMFDKLRKV